MPTDAKFTLQEPEGGEGEGLVERGGLARL